MSLALWRAVRAKAYEEGISIHELRASLFQAYLDGRIEVTAEKKATPRSKP